MIRIRMDAGRLARSRFALSRAAEMTNGLEVLVHPSRAPYAHRWVGGVARRLDQARIGILLAIVEHASWYVPDFLVPVPAGYEPSLDEELAAIEATPAEQVRRELRLAYRVGDQTEVAGLEAAGTGKDRRGLMPRPVAEVLDRTGEEGLAHRLAAELHAFWHSEMHDLWPSVRTVLDDDVRRHAVRASRRGFHHLLDDIHAQLSWDGTSLTVHIQHETAVDVRHGPVFLPSAFLPRPAVWLEQQGTAMIGYPALGRGRVWTADRSDGSGLVGQRLSTLLADLDVARTTHELATRHELAPSTVSYHLTRLHRAGLVTRRRAGQRVLYERTKRAADTLAALVPEQGR